MQRRSAYLQDLRRLQGREEMFYAFNGGNWLKLLVSQDKIQLANPIPRPRSNCPLNWGGGGLFETSPTTSVFSSILSQNKLSYLNFTQAAMVNPTILFPMPQKGSYPGVAAAPFSPRGLST